MRKNKIIFVVAILLILTICLAGCGAGKGFGYAHEDINGNIPAENGANFNEIVENPFVDPSITPSASFGLSVNTASYTWIKNAIKNGNKVEPNSVRIEDMVNYFDYSFAAPKEGLAIGNALMNCPWNSENKLLTVNVKAEELQMTDKRNNIVLLIDTSGSMFGDDKLPLVQETLTMMVELLSENDTVSIVTYAGSSKVLLNGENGGNKKKISAVIEDLSANGSTNGSGAIQKAYKIAHENFIEGGNNQILLCTDGDFNVGISKSTELIEFIKKEASEKFVNLSIFGYGMDNLRFDLMEDMANNGNGSQYFISDNTDARRAIVEGMNGMMNIVARDAKAQVTFNPDTVKNYRLIGYENRMMTAEDFEDGSKDSGEIGSGHEVTAMFEVALKDGVLANDKLGTAVIKYKNSENEVMPDLTSDINAAVAETPNEDMIFIGAVIEFGLILRGSKYAGDASINSIIGRLDTLGSVRADERKAEFLEVVRIYQSTYNSVFK